MEKMPYPTTPANPLIFEEESAEYTSVTEHSTSSPDQKSMTAVQILLDMVENGRYASADALRAELVGLGVSIPPSHLYEKLAQYALRPTFPADRLVAFSNWFSLVPDARTKPRKFRSLRSSLFVKAHIPELDIIMRFGLIAASKGHAKYITPQVISTVVRYAKPEVSAQYLAAYEKEAMMWKKGSVKGVKNAKRGILILKDMHSLAVRTQAIEGRLKEAVGLLQAARNRGINISGFTYGMLLRRLRGAGDEQQYALVRQLAPTHVHDKFHASTPPLFADELAQASTLASRLRALRKIIVPNSHVGIPHNELALFIHDYKEATGRDRAIALLRNRAFKHGHAPASDWAMAELLYHHHRNEHRLVLIVFKNFFHLVGVPADMVRFYIKVLSPHRKARTKFRWVRYIPNDFVLSIRYNLQAKLWPTPHHTALVWVALAWLNNHRTLEKLYRRLLLQIHESRAPATALADSRSASSAIPSSVVHDVSVKHDAEEDLDASLARTQSHVVDGAHFTPFLVAFTKRGQVGRAIQLMADMMTLGIKPTVEHWTILAGSCARNGDARQVFRILDSMEADGARADMGDNPTIIRFPAPTLATYTNVMQSFVRARRLDDALNIKARIMTKCQYVVGESRTTDHALFILKTLQEELKDGHLVFK